jgi:hypothetical protein
VAQRFFKKSVCTNEFSVVGPGAFAPAANAKEFVAIGRSG